LKIVPLLEEIGFEIGRTRFKADRFLQVRVPLALHILKAVLTAV